MGRTRWLRIVVAVAVLRLGSGMRGGWLGRKGLGGLVCTLAVGAGILFPGMAQAHKSGFPLHDPGNVYCGADTVAASPDPYAGTVSGNDYVYYQTKWFVWNGSRWAFVDRFPWNWAFASPTGLLTDWYDDGTQTPAVADQITFNDFGYIRVKYVFLFDDGSKHSQLGYHQDINGNRLRYCTVTP